MARQCPHGHDGIKAEEVVDDTSTKHQLTKPRHHRGQGLATREQARGRHGRGPELRRRRGCEQPGSNRVDLTDRRNRRRLIYRLSDISAAETDGACRNRARRRRGDTVAREVVWTPVYHPGFPLCIQFMIPGRPSLIHITELALQSTSSIT
jgi:hypothetical protein